MPTIDGFSDCLGGTGGAADCEDCPPEHTRYDKKTSCIQSGPKNENRSLFLLLTSSNLNQFSEFFHHGKENAKLMYFCSHFFGPLCSLVCMYGVSEKYTFLTIAPCNKNIASK